MKTKMCNMCNFQISVPNMGNRQLLKVVQVKRSKIIRCCGRKSCSYAKKLKGNSTRRVVGSKTTVIIVPRT